MNFGELYVPTGESNVLDIRAGSGRNGRMSDDALAKVGPGFKELSFVLAAPVRWRMLEILGGTDFLPLNEIARLAGLERSTATKHIAVIRKAGLVRTVHGRLYELVPEIRPVEGRMRIGPVILVLPLR